MMWVSIKFVPSERKPIKWDIFHESTQLAQSIFTYIKLYRLLGATAGGDSRTLDRVMVNTYRTVYVNQKKTNKKRMGKINVINDYQFSKYINKTINYIPVEQWWKWMHDPWQQGTEISISTTTDLVGHLPVIWRQLCTLYSEKKQSPPSTREGKKEVRK